MPIYFLSMMMTMKIRIDHFRICSRYHFVNIFIDSSIKLYFRSGSLTSQSSKSYGAKFGLKIVYFKLFWSLQPIIYNLSLKFTCKIDGNCGQQRPIFTKTVDYEDFYWVILWLLLPTMSIS